MKTSHFPDRKASLCKFLERHKKGTMSEVHPFNIFAFSSLLCDCCCQRMPHWLPEVHTFSHCSLNLKVALFLLLAPVKASALEEAGSGYLSNPCLSQL